MIINKQGFAIIIVIISSIMMIVLKYRNQFNSNSNNYSQNRQILRNVSNEQQNVISPTAIKRICIVNHNSTNDILIEKLLLLCKYLREREYEIYVINKIEENNVQKGKEIVANLSKLVDNKLVKNHVSSILSDICKTAYLGMFKK